MYNKIWKKGFVLGVIAVFVFMSIAPSSNGRLITPKNTAFSTCEDHPCADIVVSITYPETAVYMNGQKLFPFFVPLILHGVTYVLTVIETTVEIERVEFWINGVLQFVDDAVPF
ncbi:MAG: hypothetical protein KKG04_09625, partial [Candidatus Thermoplasmatota archaeon]|nr:hypothetical protein [Candidatus Thermoplasmatota archaeon]